MYVVAHFDLKRVRHSEVLGNGDVLKLDVSISLFISHTFTILYTASLIFLMWILRKANTSCPCFP